MPHTATEVVGPDCRTLRRLRCAALCDQFSQFQHVVPRVQAVAVDRVTAGSELASFVPAPKRWKAHAQKFCSFRDRQGLGRVETTGTRHVTNRN